MKLDRYIDRDAFDVTYTKKRCLYINDTGFQCRNIICEGSDFCYSHVHKIKRNRAITSLKEDGTFDSEIKQKICEMESEDIK